MRSTAKTKTDGKRRAVKDLAAKKTGCFSGCLVVNWVASKPSRPGEERGVIAIIKTTGGA